jgi:hypothetical protein
VVCWREVFWWLVVSLNRGVVVEEGPPKLAKQQIAVYHHFHKGTADSPIMSDSTSHLPQKLK